MSGVIGTYKWTFCPTTPIHKLKLVLSHQNNIWYLYNQWMERKKNYIIYITIIMNFLAGKLYYTNSVETSQYMLVYFVRKLWSLPGYGQNCPSVADITSRNDARCGIVYCQKLNESSHLKTFSRLMSGGKRQWCSNSKERTHNLLNNHLCVKQ